MSLVSFPYALFVLGLLPVYYRLSRTGQNALLLAASLAFLSLLDVRGAALLAFATGADFWLGQRLAWDRPDGERQRFLWLSVGLDVALLLAFKYQEPVLGLLGRAGASGRHFVPIGLSFYTLARLTHTLDVYFRVIPPSESYLEFALFSSFFPTLTSGPVERARRFLPQLGKRRRFDLGRAHEALWLVLLGLFKKVYVADTCGAMVPDFFDLEAGPNGADTLVGIYAYAVQLYADFAGYSDMARGVAWLFGIDLTQNFQAPYLAPSLALYWKRWHVSLSSFLDDYVFAPTSMAARNLGTAGVVLAIWVTFLVSGLWHGTGFTFLAWGALHALGLTVYVLTQQVRKKIRRRAPLALTVLGTMVTFHWICLGYVFFRAESVSVAVDTLSCLSHPYAMTPRIRDSWFDLVTSSALLLFLDGMALGQKGPLWVFSQPVRVRAVCYAVVLFCIVRLHAPAEAFVYAQF